MSSCLLIGNNGYFGSSEIAIVPSGMAFSNTGDTSSIFIGQDYQNYCACAIISNVIMSLDYYSTNSALSFISGITGIWINSEVIYHNILDSNLILFYQFSENSGLTVFDYSGNSYSSPLSKIQ